jgi:ATP/maltotriose-dependent transcriptional regulator MalT
VSALHSVVSRPRALALLESQAERRATFVCAPRGYGKSAALREYAARVPSAFVALPASASLARFGGDLARAMAGHVPGIGLSFAGAYERASQRPDPAAMLAHWFVGAVGTAPCTIVIDDLHAAAGADVARFLVAAVERSPASLHWVVATETIDDAIPISSWLAHGLTTLPLGTTELRLDLEDAKALARRVKSVRSAGEIERLLETTGGALGDFVFLIRQPANAEDNDFEHAAARTFESLDLPEQTFLFATLPLPSLRSEFLERLEPAQASLLRSLRRKAPHVFEADGARYHGGFRGYVRARMDSLEADARAAYFAGAARALEGAGDVAGAVQILIGARDEAAIVRLIVRHGFAWIEGEQSHVLHDALGALGDEARSAHATIMALRAMFASLGGRLDVSEALFQRALAKTVEPAERLRINYHYASDLMRRGRPDAIDLLQPDEHFLDAPAELRIAVMSALGAAYAIAGEMEQARKWVDRALGALPESRDGVLAARVHHQAAFVAMHAGDAPAAKRLAATASSLAERETAYEVAGGAYSVRYQLALDVDDDPRSAAAHLARIAVCAAKCGSLDKQLYAAAAGFDIAVERGDDDAIALLERELAQLDVQYSARTAMEGLLPAKALLLAGRGDFARAYELLKSSAEQQPSDDRRALRFAEIAVYAAGSGASAEAGAAAVAALKLDKRTSRVSIRSLRTRLFAALALVVVGRLNAPRLLVAAVRRDLPAGLPRLASFAGALEALIARRSGARNHRILAAALQTMHALDFGGVARVLESLPSRGSGALTSTSGMAESA